MSISAWRNYEFIYCLVGLKCVSCKKTYYPQKSLCSCGSKEFVKVKLPRTGKLLTFTKVSNSTKAFESYTPYLLGIVELKNNINNSVKVLGQICDSKLEDLKIGMPVKAVFRKLYEEGEHGVIQYGIKFKIYK